MTKFEAENIRNEWYRGGDFRNLFLRAIQAADENNFLCLYLDLIQSPFFEILDAWATIRGLELVQTIEWRGEDEGSVIVYKMEKINDGE